MSKPSTVPTTSRTLTVSLPRDRPNICVGADTYSHRFEGL